MASRFRIERDGDGWGVQSESPKHGWLFENQQPFPTRKEAERFRDSMIAASAEWAATQRYWSQESFGA
jgi:hypothetical protein